MAVATIFNGWFPTVLNDIDPWRSTENLKKGTTWISELKKWLTDSNGVGLFFLTDEAASSSWLLFEAGSISALGHERVCPVYVDVEADAVKPPLSLLNVSVNGSGIQEATQRLHAPLLQRAARLRDAISAL